MKKTFLIIMATTIIFACNNEKKADSSPGGTKKDSLNPSQAGNNIKGADSTKKQDIILIRTFDAPVEAVWKAWTEPKQVMRWWGPLNYTSPYCKIDLREGGKYVFGMRAPKEQGGKDLYSSGIYNKIIPNEFLEFTQGLSDKEGNRVDPTTLGMPADFPIDIPTTLVFKPADNKTELVVTEYGWKPGQMRDYSEMGMSECLDKLAIFLNKSNK